PTYTVRGTGPPNGHPYLAPPPPLGTTVVFTTSDTSIAPAPATVTITNGSTYVPFVIHGGNTGTATITANVGGTRAGAVIFVSSASINGFTALYNSGVSTVEIGAAAILYAHAHPPPAPAVPRERPVRPRPAPRGS